MIPWRKDDIYVNCRFTFAYPHRHLTIRTAASLQTDTYTMESAYCPLLLLGRMRNVPSTLCWSILMAVPRSHCTNHVLSSSWAVYASVMVGIVSTYIDDPPVFSRCSSIFSIICCGSRWSSSHLMAEHSITIDH